MSSSVGVRFHEAVHGVYFDDLDAFQILHNARYLLLFERTIGSFWQRQGWGSTLDMQKNPDQFHLVRANHIEYHRAVVGVSEVRVRVWVEHLGTTSLKFGFCVMPLDEDIDCATGSRVIVRVDADKRTPTPWTPHFRAQIAPFLRSVAP
ncbi:MAG: hypothetical protein H6Q89_3380 [Myxococcaceae bacterium]|nr:hypothetical protein [Myxococcaceae bacterium]